MVIIKPKPKPENTSASDYVEKLEPQDIADGNVKWRRHYEQPHGSPKTLNTELPYDPEIPLPGIHLK